MATTTSTHRSGYVAAATLVLLLAINLMNYIDRQVLSAVESR